VILGKSYQKNIWGLNADLFGLLGHFYIQRSMICHAKLG